jgi:hypothetical protein
LLTAEVRLTGEKYMDSSTEDYRAESPSFRRWTSSAVKRWSGRRNIPGVEDVALVDCSRFRNSRIRVARLHTSGTECIDRFGETNRSEAVDQSQVFWTDGHSGAAGPRRHGAGHAE